MAEQRYEAVRAVLADGETVTDVAARFGVARKTVHHWLRKYEAGGIEELEDRSHRPRSCPHQMSAEVEVMIARMRRAHPSWGPRRLVFELAKAGAEPVPSESGVYRALSRLGRLRLLGRAADSTVAADDGMARLTRTGVTAEAHQGRQQCLRTGPGHAVGRGSAPRVRAVGRSASWELKRWSYVDQGGGAEDTVLVAGSGRSGTTWIEELVNRNRDYRVLFEPFRSRHVPQLRPFGDYRYVPPDKADPEFAAVVEPILTGRVRNRWIDHHNTVRARSAMAR